MRLFSAALALVFSISLGLLGCGGSHDLQDEDPSLVSVKNGRLVFRTTESFYETIGQLDSMNQQKLDAWESKFKIDSYQKRFSSSQQRHSDSAEEQSSIDEDFFSLPSSYRAIINTNGEVQIGEDILWYNNGNIYSVPANDEALLRKIKMDPSIASPKGKYSITQIADSSESNSDIKSGLADIGIFNGLDARYQREFYYMGDTGSRRKYVHELYSYTQSLGLYDPALGPGYTYSSRLYLTYFPHIAELISQGFSIHDSRGIS